MSDNRQQRNNSNTITPSRAETIISQHEDLYEETQANYQAAASMNFFDDEEDETQDAPLLHAMYGRNDKNLLIMTGFKYDQIIQLWEIVKPTILASVGRGRKSRYGPLDTFYLVLVHLKYAENYAKFGLDYNMDAAQACRMIVKAIKLLRKPLEEHFLASESMYELVNGQQLCTSHWGIKLIVDVHFQPSNRPVGRFSEAKIYFSGKHHDYGLKTETAHFPDGRVVAVSCHFPGSTHDFTIFKENIEVYKKF